MGMSQEVKDFAAGFTSGFKMMDDSFYKQALSDYYANGGKRGRRRRNNSPNLIQRLFGAEEKKYDDPHEEALANLKADREQKLRDGDIAGVKQIDKNILDVGAMAGMKPSGSAGPSSTPRASAPKPAPQAIPAEPNTAPTETEPKVYPSETPPVDNVFKSNYEQPESAALDVEPASLETDIEPFEPEVSDWLAGGGLVGGQWPVEDENDPGYDNPNLAIPDNTSPENAPYKFEGEYEPEYSPDYSDDEASIDVTQKMAQAAAPGIDAGLRRMQAQFAPSAGLPDAEPAVAQGAEALARNEGAASREEVAAIDRVVDPEGKLPASAKSAARIAAVWDFYSKTDPDKAADLAQRLMLYDKQQSQTRGELAKQAIEQGNFPAAVKLIRDGFNENVPGGGMIQQAVMRDDGQVEVTARSEEGPKTFTAPKEMIVKVADDMAKGKGWTQEVLDQAARSQAALKGPKGAGRGTAVNADIASEYMTANLRLRQAIQSNDPKAIEAARSTVQAVEEKAIQFASRQKNPAQSLRNMGINPNPPQRSAQAPKEPKGPQPTERERAAAREQGRVDRVNKFMDNADNLDQAGVRVVNEGARVGQAIPADGSRRVSEGTRIEEARRTIEPIRNSLERERAAIGYDQARPVGKKDSTFDDRSGPESALMENIRGFVRAKMEKDTSAPTMDPTQQREFARLADNVMKKNDVDPGQVVEFLWGAQNDLSKPVKVDKRTGRVQFGNAKLFVDPDTLTEIAAVRGRKMQEAIADRNKKWDAETDAYWKREQDALIARETQAREQNAPTVKNKQSEDPKVQLRERGIPTNSDYKQREIDARRRRDAEDDYGIPPR